MSNNRRKEKRYIEFRGLRWNVPPTEWGEYLKRGLLIRISARVARLRAGVDVIFENGRHVLRDLARKIEVSIPSSWRLVERASLFDTSGPKLTPEALQREIQRDYCRTYDAWQVV